MNREDIIKLAREAGIPRWDDHEPLTVEHLERFANLVAAAKEQEVLERIRHIIVQAEERGAAAEREAIAQMFDDPPPLASDDQNKQGGCLICGFTPAVAAKVIRARGQR